MSTVSSSKKYRTTRNHAPVFVTVLTLLKKTNVFKCLRLSGSIRVIENERHINIYQITANLANTGHHVELQAACNVQTHAKSPINKASRENMHKHVNTENSLVNTK